MRFLVRLKCLLLISLRWIRPLRIILFRNRVCFPGRRCRWRWKERMDRGPELAHQPPPGNLRWFYFMVQTPYILLDKGSGHRDVCLAGSGLRSVKLIIRYIIIKTLGNSNIFSLLSKPITSHCKAENKLLSTVINAICLRAWFRRAPCCCCSRPDRAPAGHQHILAKFSEALGGF